jgi:hypothetical protein
MEDGEGETICIPVRVWEDVLDLAKQIELITRKRE